MMMPMPADFIAPATAITLDGLFAERVKRTPAGIACRDFDYKRAKWRLYTWADLDREVARWQAALEREGLAPGDRVAVMVRNSPEWVIFDQAALGLGLIVVPLYVQDRPENVAYIIHDAGCKMLLLETIDQWRALAPLKHHLAALIRLVTIRPLDDGIEEPRLKSVGQWLPDEGGASRHLKREGGTLATIVYTSGTTGRPKGVMLSHSNLLTNAYACLQCMTITPADVFLSFLPLSHTFERTCGYYLPVMAGAVTVYARSIPQLGEDLRIVRPTFLVSVPRIYERIYSAIQGKLHEAAPWRRRLFTLAVRTGYALFEHRQGRAPWQARLLMWPLLDLLVARRIRARFGGRLRAALSGGAALPPAIARLFIGLGLTVLQGYGLTETGPVCSANRPEDNVPDSVGKAMPGVEVRLGEQNALLVKGPNVMLGYWNNPEATRAIISEDGWLDTGDTARIDEGGHVYITGRLKDVVVMSNGEKLPPADMESAILHDPLFEQVMVVGEAKPYLSVIAVVNPDKWRELAAELGIDPDAAQRSRQAENTVVGRIARQLHEFPGYAQVRRVTVSFEPWTIDNGLLTPTMKLKRSRVLETFNAEIDRMYAGHV